MGKKILTIFEAIGQKQEKEECCIHFDEQLCNDSWDNSSTTSEDYDNILLIWQSADYNLYLTWYNTDSNTDIGDTQIYRKKRKGDS